MSEKKETDRFSFGEEEGKVWIIIKSGREKKGRSVIVLLTFAIIMVISLLSEVFDNEEYYMLMIPITVVSLIMGLVLFRFFGWHFFGRELITIEGNTLSYSIKYGFFRSTPQTKQYQRLSVRIDRIKNQEVSTMGRLIFLETKHQGGEPIEVFHSTLVAHRDSLLAFIRFYENHKTKREVISKFTQEISLN